MSKATVALRTGILRLTDSLPAPRDRAARELLVAGRNLATGRAPARPKPAKARKPRPSAAPAPPAEAPVFAEPGSYSSPIVNLTEVTGPLADPGDPVALPGSS